MSTDALPSTTAQNAADFSMSAYRSFIASKRIAARPSGFTVPRSALNPALAGWRGDIAQWE